MVIPGGSGWFMGVLLGHGIAVPGLGLMLPMYWPYHSGEARAVSMTGWWFSGSISAMKYGNHHWQSEWTASMGINICKKLQRDE